MIKCCKCSKSADPIFHNTDAGCHTHAYTTPEGKPLCVKCQKKRGASWHEGDGYGCMYIKSFSESEKEARGEIIVKDSANRIDFPDVKEDEMNYDQRGCNARKRAMKGRKG